MPTPSISIRPCSATNHNTHVSKRLDGAERILAFQNPVAVVVPSANAPNMTVRCDIDLSPGTRNERLSIHRAQPKTS